VDNYQHKERTPPTADEDEAKQYTYLSRSKDNKHRIINVSQLISEALRTRLDDSDIIKRLI